MDFLEDLQWRGLINQCSNLDGLRQRIKKGSITFYCGFDPSAPSLHLGNLLPLVTVLRLQKAGHKPIILIGGATGLIGDPSGKKEERPFLDHELVKSNTLKIKKQIETFFSLQKVNDFLIVDNYSWFKDIFYLDFLREIGKHFSVNYLLSKEWIKNRLETGISYAEFSYSLMQAYDFYYLYKNHHCELHLGGSDQWGNIVSGIDLIRSKFNKEVFGLTFPLLLNEQGEKFGKSEKGAIWLDAKMTSPYKMYQFLINVDDKKVIQLLKLFTFIGKNEIDSIAKDLEIYPEKRQAQKILASEIVKLIYGDKQLQRAQKISEALFYNDIRALSQKEMEEALNDVPTFDINLKDNINIVDLLVQSKIVSSKRQAREDIRNRAIIINDTLCDQDNKTITKNDLLFHKYLVVRRGKKNYYLGVVK